MHNLSSFFFIPCLRKVVSVSYWHYNNTSSSSNSSNGNISSGGGDSGDSGGGHGGGSGDICGSDSGRAGGCGLESQAIQPSIIYNMNILILWLN